MALIVKDRVKETTTTTGTSTYTLAGAVVGYQSFSVIGNGNTTYYTVTDNTNWEVGIGTYTSSGTTLSRDTILASSNSNNAVNWGAGSKDVFVTYPAGRSVYVDTTTITPGTTATLPATSGGTGLSSGTSGGVPYFSSTTTIASSAALAANALVVGGGAGAAPSTILTGTGVVNALGAAVNNTVGMVTQSGTLAANALLLGGGASVGITSTTTGTGVVTAIGNAVNTTGGLVTQSGTLAASSLLLGGGASTAISSTTTGTGVVTALGTNVGTAGAFVVNGGALGTPSSGVVTNLTGTASININGTVGATTANTGAFTTLTASADSTFSSTGALAVSKGTTAQRPGTPVTSMVRYNTTTNEFEGYSGSSPSWKSIGGSALSNDTSTASDLYPVFASATTGTAQNLYTSNAKLLYKPSTGELKVDAPIAGNGLVINSTTVATSYTVASGQNAMSVGPITVNSSVTVTVSSGQRWLVL